MEFLRLHYCAFNDRYSKVNYHNVDWSNVLFAFLLLWITLSDLRRFEIPDGANLLFAGGGALSTWLIAPDLLLSHLLATLAGSGLFASVLLLHRRARGIEGLGWGDVKLLDRWTALQDADR